MEAAGVVSLASTANNLAGVVIDVLLMASV